MKFTCTRENLMHALNIVSPLAGKQTSLPILSNILITVTDSTVQLSTTNLESAIRTNLRARIESPGSFSVPAKTFSEYVHLLTDEQVEIFLEGNELGITCGSSSTKIKGMPADEYPVIPDIEEQHGYTLDAHGFRQALSKTVVAVARNEIRPELAGVYMHFFPEGEDGMVMAATDSYRLAETKLPVLQGEDNKTCIVPGRVVYEVIRLLVAAQALPGAEAQVRLWVSDNQLAIRYGSFELTARLVDGTYPDYRQIIPKDFKTSATLPVGVAVNKIKAASLFTTIGVNAVSFDLNASQNTVNVSSTSTQTGEHASEMEADVTGEENSILLNHRYVLDGLQHMESEQFVFSVNSGDTPCVLKPQKDVGYLYIVMPIRQ